MPAVLAAMPVPLVLLDFVPCKCARSLLEARACCSKRARVARSARVLLGERAILWTSPDFVDTSTSTWC